MYLFTEPSGRLSFGKEDYERINRAYKAAVTLTMELYPFVYPNIFDFESRSEFIHGVPGAKASYENGIVKFTINELPPHIKSKESIQAKLKEHWIGLISYAFAKMDKEIFFKKAFCLIRVNRKMKAPWDTDNRIYKYIIDGIRYARIVRDDNCKCLSYMVMGEPDAQEDKTEILICDFDKVQEKFKILGML